LTERCPFADQSVTFKLNQSETRATGLEGDRNFYRSQSEAATTRHADDIRVIGERLLREANARNWCSEFDEIVESLNRVLNIELERRMKTFTVTVPVTITLSVEAQNSDRASDVSDALYGLERYITSNYSSVTGAEIERHEIEADED
jgi:hypothetical protein